MAKFTNHTIEKNEFSVVVKILSSHLVEEEVHDIKKDIFMYGNTTPLTIDFSSVRYIDSSGIAFILTVVQRFKKDNNSVFFSNLSQEIDSLFKDIGIYNAYKNVTKL